MKKPYSQSFLLFVYNSGMNSLTRVSQFEKKFYILFLFTLLFVDINAQPPIQKSKEIQHLKSIAEDEEFLKNQIQSRKENIDLNRAFAARLEDSLKVTKNSGEDISGLALSIFKIQLRIESDNIKIQQMKSLLEISPFLSDEVTANKKFNEYIATQNSNRTIQKTNIQNIVAKYNPLITDTRLKNQFLEIIKQLEIQ